MMFTKNYLLATKIQLILTALAIIFIFYETILQPYLEYGKQIIGFGNAVYLFFLTVLILKLLPSRKKIYKMSLADGLLTIYCTNTVGLKWVEQYATEDINLAYFYFKQARLNLYMLNGQKVNFYVPNVLLLYEIDSMVKTFQ
jgi:hypothetical protein